MRRPDSGSGLSGICSHFGFFQRQGRVVQRRGDRIVVIASARGASRGEREIHTSTLLPSSSGRKIRPVTVNASSEFQHPFNVGGKLINRVRRGMISA